MVGGGDKIAQVRVLWTRSNFAQTGARHQSREPGATRPRRQRDDRGDFTGQSTGGVRQRIGDRLVGVIERGTADSLGTDLDPEIERRSPRSGDRKGAPRGRRPTCVGFRSPLLDEAEGVEDATDDTAAQQVNGREQLGSCSEAQGVRVKTEHWLFGETLD